MNRFPLETTRVIETIDPVRFEQIIGDMPWLTRKQIGRSIWI